MKKLLLSTMMLAAGIFAASAAETTFVFSELYGPENNTDLVAKTSDGVTVEFNSEGAQTKAQYYKTGTSVRLYASNQMTISVPEGSTITKVDYELRDASYNHGEDDSFYPVDNGTFTVDFEAYTAEWTGSSSSFTLTISSEKNSENKNVQLHIRSLTVTYTMGEETKCSTPKFSVAEGSFYTPVSVELSSNTEDAVIMYAINGGAEQEYSAPIELSEVGTYAISAYAKKDGLENSETATATYEIKAPTQVVDIDDFIANGEAEVEGTVFEWTFPVTVTAQMPSYLYVKDEKGYAMLIYGSQVPSYNVGDVIPAGIQGTFKNYNGLYEMQYPEASTFGEATDNVKVYYPVLTAGAVTADDMNKVVYLDNVTYTADGKTLSDDSGSITAYFQKNWTDVVAPADGLIDVIAAVSVYSGTAQLYPIEFKDASNVPEQGSVNSAVASAVAVSANAEGVVVNAGEAVEVEVFNAAGQLVKTATVANGVVAVPSGFYVVKAGDTVAKVIVK